MEEKTVPINTVGKDYKSKGNSGGKKGLSGRPSLRDEKTHREIIEKAWELIKDKLNSNDIARFSVAKEIVLKDITTKVQGEGFETIFANLIGQLPKGDLRSIIDALRERAGSQRPPLDVGDGLSPHQN